MRRPPTSPLALAAFVFFATLLAATPALAQDNHYWSEQFGNRAYLLAGAVVGDPLDLSSIYYNPGGLAASETTEFLLAGLGIEVTSVTIKDALLGGEDLGKTSTRFVPSLIAGEIPLGSDRHRLAYSILTRHRSDLRMFSKVNRTGEEFDIPELSLVSNSLGFQTELSEYWVGGTWSWGVRSSFGVGASTFLAYRDQRADLQSLLQILSTDNRAGVLNRSSGYKYKHWRLLWKLGAAGRFSDWDFGLTITTPSVGLGGHGDVNSNFTAVGQTVDDQGNPLTFLATDIQHKVSVDYRSPFSVAVGASRSFGPATLHLTAEWFEAVGLYDVVEALPFESQTDGIVIDPAIRQRLESVFNIGVAGELLFNDEIKGYFGFHTDFSAASPDPAANLGFSSWDIYHLSGGATFELLGTDLTLGANLGMARDTIEARQNDSFGPIVLPDDTEVRFHKLTIILGFNFAL